jgi:hypothetical protein
LNKLLYIKEVDEEDEGMRKLEEKDDNGEGKKTEVEA